MAFLICFKEWGSKLSLKDRLKTPQKTTAAKSKQEQTPKYYNSSEEIPQYDSLGIIDSLLIDDEINNIFVSGAKNVYIEKNGKTHKSTSTFRDNVQLENLIRKIANSHGIDLNTQNTINFNHKQGINIFATIPPLSNEVTIYTKCYFDRHATLAKLQEENSVSKEIGLILEALCAIKKNILIVGENSTLKTTLLSAMAKKVPSNNRIVIIDNQCELKIKNFNSTSYDFTKLSNDSAKKELLSQILATQPDKLFINDNSAEILYEIMNKIQKKYKGVIATLEANTPDDAIEYLIQDILENNANITPQKAKSIVLNTFDIIILVKKDDLGKRYISKISEIDLSAQENFTKDIFAYDYTNQHKSLGIVPDFYKDIKNNSLPISDNIFDENYKHTYNKPQDCDIYGGFNKKSNIDILKKFKKELPTQSQNMQSDSDVQDGEEMQEKQQTQLDEEYITKKVQEKFNEIKNNNEQNQQNETLPTEENPNE